MFCYCIKRSQRECFYLLQTTVIQFKIGDFMGEYHDRQNMRMKGYDYRTPGYYAVVQCIEQRHRLLSYLIWNGSSETSPMVELTPIGKIVEEEIKAAEKHYPVSITPFAIMPEHIHLLVKIKVENVTKLKNDDGTPREPVSLSDIIGGIKSRAILRIPPELFDWRKEKFWQWSFYDHVIRNDDDLFYEINYINDNARHHYFGKTPRWLKRLLSFGWNPSIPPFP